MASGRTADVWEARDGGGTKLAAKVFHVLSGEDYKIKAGSSLVDYDHTTHFHFRGTIRRSQYGSDWNTTMWSPLSVQDPISLRFVRYRRGCQTELS